MIGFVTTQSQAQAANDAVAQAQTDRGMPVFWLPGSYQIFSGPFTGGYFVPCDDNVMHTPLIGNPPRTPMDYPEFLTIVDSLGGLDSRVDVPPSDITRPEEP